MPFGGARERCFCAYGQTDLTECPSWRDWVSTDGIHPDRLLRTDEAVVIAGSQGNSTAGRYQYVRDWAVDLGSGYDKECNSAIAPRCESDGAHVLSIPRNRYIRDCCSSTDNSLASLLRPRSVPCALLKDLVGGPLHRIDHLGKYPSCKHQGQEPTLKNGCLAQCFHIVPDVWFLHLHTTAGVKRVRAEDNAGLGPAYNASAAAGKGKYNVCVCEPRAWDDGRGRGSCPSVRPSHPQYVAQAAVSLCQNLAGASGVDPAVCLACDSS